MVVATTDGPSGEQLHESEVSDKHQLPAKLGDTSVTRCTVLFTD